MEVRFFLDPDTGQPHIFGHGVTEEEAEQILRGSGEDLPAARGSRMKLGQTGAGRYLQVIYVPDEDGEGVFVITPTSCRARPRRRFAADGGGDRDDRAEVSARLG